LRIEGLDDTYIVENTSFTVHDRLVEGQ